MIAIVTTVNDPSYARQMYWVGTDTEAWRWYEWRAGSLYAWRIGFGPARWLIIDQVVDSSEPDLQRRVTYLVPTAP
jgi:hypothetical protein